MKFLSDTYFPHTCSSLIAYLIPTFQKDSSPSLIQSLLFPSSLYPQPTHITKVYKQSQKEQNIVSKKAVKKLNKQSQTSSSPYR